ncbi:MAG: glycosyltransferase family 4 protein [Mycetocola sp.]
MAGPDIAAPPPTALWVCPVADLAGVARHIIDTARAGLPGWRLVVAAPEGPLLRELRELGTSVIPMPGEGGSTAANVTALRRAIARLRPRIAHSHLAKADILLAAASAALPVTLVTTEHHISPDRYMFHPSRASATTMEIVHRARLTRFSGAIAVSASTKRDMVARWRPNVPIEVILNGVDRPVRRPERGPGLRMLSLSRLSPEKNVAMTLRAFARALELQPSAMLTVAGAGEQDAALRALARGLGLARRVHFAGFVDAERAMVDHDVLLQPSRSDNCSYALLDAVAVGMGVAASPVGGNPEILPARCIADLDDDAHFAEIAVTQGLHLSDRPDLGDSVPSVAEMTRRIVAVYDATLEHRRRHGRHTMQKANAG